MDRDEHNRLALKMLQSRIELLTGTPKPNPDRRWWQFWKPKFVYEPKRIRVFDEGEGAIKFRRLSKRLTTRPE